MPLSIFTQFFNFFSFLNFNSCFYLVFLLNPPQHVRLFKILVSLANQSIINKIHRAMIINLYFYTRSIIPKHPVSTRDGTGTWNKPGNTGICSSIPDPKGLGIRCSVVSSNLKDKIDGFEARHMIKSWKNFLTMENLTL